MEQSVLHYLIPERATFDSRESYEKSDEDEYALHSTELEINDRKGTVLFEQLPFADYAVKLYHDENRNKKLDKNFFGIPNEGYGFSNDPGSIAVPSYDKAKFTLTSDNFTLEIKIKN